MGNLLNNNLLELRPLCGRNCERTAFAIRTILNYTEFGIIRNLVGLIMSNSTQLNLSNSIGLDLKWSNLTTLNAVFINKGMPQRDRLIELNKIAIQQMKVQEGVEERRMLK